MLGYSERSKGYRVYNTETKIVEESINIRFDDKLGHQKPKLAEISADIEVYLIDSEESETKNLPEATPEVTPLATNLDNLRTSEEPTDKRSSRITSAHPEEMILGKKDDPIRTRSFLINSESSLIGLVSLI